MEGNNQNTSQIIPTDTVSQVEPVNQTSSPVMSMPKVETRGLLKKIISIIVLAFLVITLAWFFFGREVYAPTNDSTEKSLGAVIYEDISAQKAGEATNSNPFKDTSTNPVEKVYVNPFAE